MPFGSDNPNSCFAGNGTTPTNISYKLYFIQREDNINGKKTVYFRIGTEGHPDKICDQISDAVLDAILAQDPKGRVACETTVTTGIVYVMGEITTNC